ncbi:MAG TPA: hypothetical protein VFG62_11420 [Rhodopila sp.]|nr:hypothetical protein [Rhodopila sp.]
MSENTKLRLDSGAGENQSDRQNRTPDDIAPIDEAESQMRKALGLLGETPRHRPDAERVEVSSRPSGSLGPFGGGLHRRRFVQDGDVPVTVLRRDQQHDSIPHRTAPSNGAPTSSRLQRAEAALAAETALRERAERALNEAQSGIRDLQTKIGHAELAKNEALETLRRERETIAQGRSEFDGLQTDLRMVRDELADLKIALEQTQNLLEEERHGRKVAEKAQKSSESAREEAERLIQALSEAETLAAPAVTPANRVAVPVKSNRAPRGAVKANGDLCASETPKRGAAEPEPVKWWLNTTPPAKRR